MDNYKLPKCWLGRFTTVVDFDEESLSEMREIPVTEDMVNMNCHCLTPMQAFFCMEGHLTECHAGMNCEEAECGHYQQEGEMDEESGQP